MHDLLRALSWHLGIFIVCCCGCADGTVNGPTVTDAAPTRMPSTKVPQNDRVEATERYSSVPSVTTSARGWSISTQPRAGSEPDTIIQSPNGQRFNAGYTGVPDYHRPILWILGVSILKRKFLVIYLYPVASESSTLSLYVIRDNHVICKAAQIAHHFEWTNRTKSAQIIYELFSDHNNDGKPELVEDEVGKFGGIVTYYEFNGETFSPRWRETYKPDENDKMSRVSGVDLRQM